MEGAMTALLLLLLVEGQPAAELKASNVGQCLFQGNKLRPRLQKNADATSGQALGMMHTWTPALLRAMQRVPYPAC